MIIEVKNEDEMKEFGAAVGALQGGEIIELIGDVGAGKTTLTKGIARGLGIDEDVQSPSFTISRLYDGRDNLQLAHYDFYRLSEPGIMRADLDETMHDPNIVTVIEWAGIVEGVLPDDRITIMMSSPAETDRHLDIVASGQKSNQLVEKL